MSVIGAEGSCVDVVTVPMFNSIRIRPGHYISGRAAKFDASFPCARKCWTKWKAKCCPVLRRARLTLAGTRRSTRWADPPHSVPTTCPASTITPRIVRCVHRNSQFDGRRGPRKGFDHSCCKSCSSTAFSSSPWLFSSLYCSMLFLCFSKDLVSFLNTLKGNPAV